MSLSSIMNAGMTGLMTAQTQLRVVSDNVANVNTPGYVRKVAEQQALIVDGRGVGVEVSRVRLATDRYLQAASLNAGSAFAQATVRSELMDRVQSLFGDPAGGGLFSRMDEIWAAFSTAAENPTSGPHRQEAVFKIDAFFDEAARVAREIQSVRQDADGRIVTAVETVNNLLQQIEALNVEISRTSISGGDASGAESLQAGMIDQLAALMDVRVQPREHGGVTLRSNTGLLLAGAGAATVEYQRATSVNGQTSFNEIWITEPRGEKRSLAEHVGAGEIKGLLQLRDQDAPQAADRLAELVARTADEINRAHNANTAAPAPAILTGRDTGLDLPTAISGFAGRTTVAITDASGVIQRRVEIDFTAGTLTVDGAAFGGFTPANFQAQMNAALGGFGTVSFADRALSIQATGAGNGVAVADDATTPSAKVGMGFSHYFGLNDLVRSTRLYTYDTGLTGASAHGFTPGQEISFRFRNEAGVTLRDVSVQVPTGGTMNDLLTALNDTTTGVGRFGSFSLNSSGALSFTPAVGSVATMEVAGDGTARGVGGPSFSELFGVGGVRADRAGSFSVRADVQSNSKLLALAQLNLAAAAGRPALSAGDGRGALLLSDVSERTVRFDGAGGQAGSSLSLSRYASDLAGEVGARAASFEASAKAAEGVQREANSRRSSYEGVNLDEELVKMTTFQQAYAASARLIQASKDMYDVLLGMM